MVLARLLSPKDFGLVGMVMAFTGILTLLRDFGLSSAAIQRTTVTEEQISTLFWINMLLGALLGLDRSRHGAGYCRLLRRTSAFWGDGCPGAWISFQRGRNTTLSTSSTRNALYGLGRNKRGLSDGGNGDRHWLRRSWLGILGPGGDVDRFSACQHSLPLADQRLGPE